MALSAVLAWLVLGSAAARAAPEWHWDAPPQVRFVAEAAGTRFEGGFGTAEVGLQFAADDLAGSRVVARVVMGSLDSGNAERDEILAGPAWFDLSAHGEATFTSSAITAAPGGGYTAEGTLTIRGRPQPMTVPFTVTDAAAGGHRITAEFTLQRLAFGLGEGEWADTAQIPDPVTVQVELTGSP